MTAITDHHRFGGLKLQKLIFSQLGRPKSQQSSSLSWGLWCSGLSHQPLQMLTSHVGTSVQVPSASLSIQLPVSAPGNADEDGSNVCGTHLAPMWKTQMDFEVLRFGLVLPRL